MQISNYIKHVLENKGVTLKWLHQEMQSYDIESNTYEYFWNKVKKDKLSAYELIVIANILEINLNLFPAMFRLAHKKKDNELDPVYEWALQQSEVKNEECVRVFGKNDNSNQSEIHYLISYSPKLDWLIAESFIFEEHKKVFLRINNGFSNLLGAFNHDYESFAELNVQETIDVINEMADSYAILYPGKIEEEYPMKTAYSNNLKDTYMKGNSVFKGKGEQITYFNVRKGFKDIQGKDVLVTLNLDAEFFAIEWFDFEMMECRTLVKSYSMFAGEPLSQEQDDFHSYNKEQILRALYDEYQDYRLNVISQEEYDEEYPIRMIYTRGEYSMNFKENVLLEGWEAWCTGNADIPAKNFTLKNGENGSVVLDSEGATVYRKPHNIVEDPNEDIGMYVENHADTPEDVQTKLGAYLTEEQCEEVKTVLSSYLKYEDSYQPYVK